MVPISQEVGHGTVKECFYHVLMNPNQNTRAWAKVWLSSCCRNVLVTAAGGRRRAELEDLGVDNTNSPRGIDNTDSESHTFVVMDLNQDHQKFGGRMECTLFSAFAY